MQSLISSYILKINSILTLCFFTAIKMGEIDVTPVADLEQVRQLVNKLQEGITEPPDVFPRLSPDWCFVDCK